MTFLETLLTQNKDLASGITAKALCLSQSKQLAENTSPLYLLAINQRGNKILNTLLDNNPDLAQGITAEVLCLPIVITHEQSLKNVINTSPLYGLTMSFEGLVFLNTLLAKNAEIAQNITAEALCLALPEDAVQHSNTSALSWLLQSKEGLKFLQALLTKNNKLAAGITIEALSLALTLERGKRADFKLFFNSLKASKSRRNILNILLDNNQDIANLVKKPAKKTPSSATLGIFASKAISSVSEPNIELSTEIMSDETSSVELS